MKEQRRPDMSGCMPPPHEEWSVERDYNAALLNAVAVGVDFVDFADV
jgi:hypothetical protein